MNDIHNVDHCERGPNFSKTFIVKYCIQKPFCLYFACLFGFLTSSSTTRLYRGRAPRQSVWQFTCCHTWDRAGRPWLLSQPIFCRKAASLNCFFFLNKFTSFIGCNCFKIKIQIVKDNRKAVNLYGMSWNYSHFIHTVNCANSEGSS